MKQEKDEFEGRGLLECVVRKNVSVGMRFMDVLFGPALVIICILIGIVALAATIYLVWPVLLPWVLALFTGALANPVIAFAVCGAIIFESYCLAWCIRYRRQKRLQKEDSACPIPTRKEE